MTIQRSDFRMAHRLRVRWVEVDMQKIVFNGHYLMYFDNAMGDYWRALAFPYEAGMHLLSGDLFVKKASVEYHGSARYDDVLDVGLRCQRIGNSSITFQGAIFRGDSLLVTSELVYVYANPATQSPTPVPPLLRSLIDDFEAGLSVVRLQTGPWAALGEAILTLRDAAWDAADAHTGTVHALVSNRLGQTIATGRLLHQSEGVGRIDRMAVVRPLKGSQLGRDVLHALLTLAQERGDTEVWVHAPCSVQGFYDRNGFVARGEVFEEAGVRHIAMAKVLSKALT